MRDPDSRLGLSASPQANERTVICCAEPTRVCMGHVLPGGMALEDHLLLASRDHVFWERGLFYRVDSDEG
jgi:hypothetical protein